MRLQIIYQEATKPDRIICYASSVKTASGIAYNLNYRARGRINKGKYLYRLTDDKFEAISSGGL